MAERGPRHAARPPGQAQRWSLKLRVLIVLLLASHILPPAASPRTAAALDAPQGVGLEFGHVIDDHGQIRFNDDIAARMAQAGASWVRINFRLGGFQNWTETDTFGVTALSRYDEIVATAQHHGLRVLGLLSNEAWHGGLANWQANSAETAGGDGGNVYLHDFTQQAALVLIAHFSGRVDEWEVWNEPNAAETYLYPSNFAWLLASVYGGAKVSGLTGARFISGGLSSVQNTQGNITPASTGADYLRQTYERGKDTAGWEALRAAWGSYPLDAIGQHLYVDGYRRTSRETIRATLSLVREAYVAGELGDGSKPIAITEIGWASGNVSERTQADNLQVAFAELMETPWVESASWFFLRDEPAANLRFGLLRPDGGEKPAWHAYRIITTPGVPPLPPSGVVTSGFPEGVRLDWHPNAAPTLAAYHVYRADDPAGPYTHVVALPAGVTSWLDETAPRETALYYRVTAVDSNSNESAPSPIVSAVITDLPGLPPFERVWSRADEPVASGTVSRTWLWGNAPRSPVLTERYDNAPGGFRQVQYFDKSRMELTDPAADPEDEWYVTNGLLVAEMMSGWLQVGDNAHVERLPAAVNVAGDPGSGPTYAAMSHLRWSSARAAGALITQRLHPDGSLSNDPALAVRDIRAEHYVANTRHTVAAPFWAFMTSEEVVERDGELALAPLFDNPFYATGFPITEAYWTTVDIAGVARDVLIQCFERRCLTYTPYNPAGWQVEAGNVGQHYYRWRYGDEPAT